MSCARSWEVSAARDGRLGAKSEKELERHLQHCDDCKREQESLEGLGERLRGTPTREPEALALRRLRGRTLEAANAASVQRFTGPRSPRLVLALAAVVFAVVIAWRYVGSRPVEETRLVATDEGDAQWTVEEQAGVRHVHVQRGALAVWVDRPAGGSRVLVHVPDGEIEDTGTIFHVAVEGGRTQRVHVDEGSVVVRLHGQAPRSIGAGETWMPVPAAPQNSENVPAPAPAPCAAPAPSARQTPAVALSVAASAPRPVVMLAPSVPAAPPVADASDEEDRAYVDIVRLLREGRDRDARSAAREYVRRFPAGFRRAEVDRVLDAH